MGSEESSPVPALRGVERSLRPMSGAESTALGPESELFIIINIILTKTGQQKALGREVLLPLTQL